jgi:hypothetical protein
VPNLPNGRENNKSSRRGDNYPAGAEEGDPGYYDTKSTATDGSSDPAAQARGPRDTRNSLRSGGSAIAAAAGPRMRPPRHSWGQSFCSSSVSTHRPLFIPPVFVSVSCSQHCCIQFIPLCFFLVFSAYLLHSVHSVNS